MTLSLWEFYTPHIEQRSEDPDYEVVVKLIGRAQMKYGMPIRADATCFLAGTIMEIIVEPMRGLHEAEYNQAFRDILFEDICVVIERSVDVAKTRQRSAITSTTAIKALGEVVEDLKLSSATAMGKAKGETKI